MSTLYTGMACPANWQEARTGRMCSHQLHPTEKNRILSRHSFIIRVRPAFTSDATVLSVRGARQRGLPVLWGAYQTVEYKPRDIGTCLFEELHPKFADKSRE